MQKISFFLSLAHTLTSSTLSYLRFHSPCKLFITLTGLEFMVSKFTCCLPKTRTVNKNTVKKKRFQIFFNLVVINFLHQNQIKKIGREDFCPVDGCLRQTRCGFVCVQLIVQMKQQHNNILYRSSCRLTHYPCVTKISQNTNSSEKKGIVDSFLRHDPIRNFTILLLITIQQP